MSTDVTAILRTLATYCQTCDDGRFDEFADCFTEDAVMVVTGPRGDEVHGRAAIRAWIERAMPPEKRGKHLTFNPLVTVTGDTADAATDYAFLARTADGPRISAAGRYLDRLVRDTDTWRISRREITFLGR